MFSLDLIRRIFSAQFRNLFLLPLPTVFPQPNFDPNIDRNLTLALTLTLNLDVNPNLDTSSHKIDIIIVFSRVHATL